MNILGSGVKCVSMANLYENNLFIYARLLELKLLVH